MFKKKALKLYRKSVKFENRYGSEMADKVVFGRIWYKIFTQQFIRMTLKLYKKSKPNHILFDARPDFSGNAKALCDYMIENGYLKRYKITWLVQEPKEYQKYRRHGIKFVQRIGELHHFHTRRSYKEALRSRYVFFTGDFSWMETKSKDQIYINLWHGCGFREGTEEEKTLTKFDYCLVPGDAFVKSKAKFFSCAKKRILPIGDARYNLFTAGRQEATAFFEKHTEGGSDLKKILWMPLYRNPEVTAKYKSGAASMMGLPLIHSLMDMPKLNELCMKNGILLTIYCNPDVMTLYKETGNMPQVRFLTEEELTEANVDLYELLPKFDALLSDFSAAAFDFLLTDKPIGYILEDYEEYKKASGFVLDDPLHYMPGDHIYDWDQLGGFFAKTAAGTDTYQKERLQVRKETHNETDDYCRRILEQFSIR